MLNKRLNFLLIICLIELLVIINLVLFPFNREPQVIPPEHLRNYMVKQNIQYVVDDSVVIPWYVCRKYDTVYIPRGAEVLFLYDSFAKVAPVDLNKPLDQQ